MSRRLANVAAGFILGQTMLRAGYHIYDLAMWLIAIPSLLVISLTIRYFMPDKDSK